MIRSKTGKSSRGGVDSKRRLAHTYDDIISVENLLAAWKEFLKGKKDKPDVQEFQLHLMHNILALHKDLHDKTYAHGAYYHFKISDPKPRDIHKATVRDRLLHHAIYRVLCPYFDRRFIHDSYSCRVGKGTHKAFQQFCTCARKCSKNHTRTCWVLKCDVKKFFASIDQEFLMQILKKYIQDENIFWLLERIVGSFKTRTLDVLVLGKGLPLGNLTSQLLVNIYMNKFDQFVKHKLKIKYYVRYADDFVLLSQNKSELERVLGYIKVFLCYELKLELHPNKVSIQTFAAGVDFLGWVHFPNHRVLRTVTKRRMLTRVRGLEKDNPTKQSYLGMLKWGNSQKLKNIVKCE